MSDEKCIKYILIGDPDLVKEIGHYPERGTPQAIIDEANEFFVKTSNSGVQKDKRNNISGQNGNYYFQINSKNIFYLILSDNNFKQSEAYQLMDKIQEENIPILKDEGTGKLNLYGRQNLKTTVEEFLKNRKNRINDIQNEVDQIKGVMQRNMTKVLENTNNLEDMEKKAENLRKGAQEYNNKAMKLQATTWWATFKWYIILGAVIILLLVIILPISLRK